MIEIKVTFYFDEDEVVNADEAKIWLTDKLSSKFEPGNDFEITGTI